LEDSFQPARYDNRNHDGTYNLAYKKLFDKDGQTLDIELNHSRMESDQVADFLTDFTDAAIPDFAYVDDIENRTEQTTANIDYIHPIGEKGKLEVGAEARLWRNHNDYVTTNSGFEPLSFDYDLDIYSAYATFGQTIGKFGYQAGLRFESYKVNAENFGERVYEDDYLTLYPSLSFTYSFKEKNILQLSYSRRVDRPGMDQVRPSREFSTPLLTSRGNPELDPQFTNSVELNLIRTLEKGSLSGGVFVRSTNDQINRVIFPDPNYPGTNRLIMTFDNFDTNTSYGFEVSGSYKITKRWDVQPAIDFSSIRQQGVISIPDEAGEFSFQNTSVTTSAFNARLNTNFRANKQWSFLLFGFYRG
ncbi:MAG: TonB-dependent receptor, partial [Flavobacterium sp.]